MEEKPEEVIQRRLKNMTEMASELKEKEGLVSRYVKKDCYVRIGGESFRAVSLKENYPLCGCKKNGAKNLETIFGHFDKKDDKKLSEGILQKKRERRLQCWIIREALKNNRDLLIPLGINDPQFEELLFALDEVSLGDNHHPVCNIPSLNLKNENKKETNAVRCDILAVGKNGSEIFPVIIELKSNRNKKKLEEQLYNFAELIKHFKKEFKELLEACTSLLLNDYMPRKIMIWPAPKLENGQTQNHLTHLNDNGINVLEYSEDKNKAYKFESYWVQEKAEVG